jgi:nucleoid-associated protein YgaU
MSAIAMQPRFVSGVGARRAPVTASTARASVAVQGGTPRTLVAGAPAGRALADRPGPARRDAAAGGAAVGEGRLHLTVRGRAVLVLLALLVVVAGVMGGRAVADGPEQATEVTTHSVQAGETLWEIAADVAAPGEDVRDVVLSLQELNGLADGSLQAGQVLLLPAGA